MSSRGAIDARNTKILVIDDDEIALQAMTDVLERAGFVVHPLVSPIGATQVIGAHGIAAAVIDLNMPVMRGDRFISLIRSWDRIRDLPIVLVSGEAPDVIHQAIAHMPGVSVVTKAHMNELLVSTLAHALQGRFDRDEESTPRTSGVGVRKPSSGAFMPVQRSLVNTARTALNSLREHAAGRSVSSHALSQSLQTVRSDAQQVGLPNTEQLLTLALELIARVPANGRMSSDVEGALGELLTQLAQPELDKVRAFDRSLALTLQRSRLERARQQLP